MQKAIREYKEYRDMVDALEQVRRLYHQRGMSNVAFGGICLFGGRSYRLNQAQDEALDKFRDNIADEHERGLFQYLDQLNDGIASYRRRSKHVDEYDPLKNAQHKSRRMAEIAVGNGFARSRINVTVGRDVGVEVNNPQSQYSKSNDLTVPLTWNKAVSERGFALVQAPDGLRLILRCSHRRIGYVEDEGFNAWEVTAVSFKHGKGEVEQGFLVTHQSSDHSHDNPLVDQYDRKTLIPHAYGTSLKKAFSLLKSRTVRHLTKMLDA